MIPSDVVYPCQLRCCSENIGFGDINTWPREEFLWDIPVLDQVKNGSKICQNISLLVLFLEDLLDFEVLIFITRLSLCLDTPPYGEPWSGNPLGFDLL